VHVDDDGQGSGGALRLDDPHAHVTHRDGDSDPFLVNREFLPRGGLKVIEDLAGGRITQLIQERGCRGRIGDVLRGGLKHDLGLNGHGDDPLDRWLELLGGTDRRLGSHGVVVGLARQFTLPEPRACAAGQPAPLAGGATAANS
jgi:hypothetical protein